MMDRSNNIPRFANSLSLFVGDLRSWVFSSQVKAARYFGLTHSTISRYENGHLIPQLGYLACLAKLFIDRLAQEGQALESYQEALLQEVNKALRLYYPDEKPFSDWNELHRITEDYLVKRTGPGHSVTTTAKRRADWGEAPDVSVFYGRQKELDELAQWIVTDGCRLVGVLGMGGVGKTTLATKLAGQIQDQFDKTIWYSLRNAPPIDDFLHECLQFLSHRPGRDSSQSVDREILRLVDHLREHRCLLVLDNAEAILREGDQAGRYRDGYEAYGDLIRSIGEMRHQSSLVLTSREKPKGIARLEGKALPVRTLRLGGLELIDGRKILKDKNLAGPEEARTVLIDRYSGNPLALKLVAEAINEVFAGDISQFLGSDIPVFGGVKELLDQQFGRLSRLESEIMYWLAIEREAISADDLQENIVPFVSGRDVVEALQSLRRRSLIEKSASGFSLQYVVLQYTTDRLIDRACEEVVSETISLLQSHALIKAQAKEYIQQSQLRLILQPIAQRLVTSLGRVALERKMKHLLANLRAEAYLAPTYAGGNILNLLLHLGYDMRGYDFSGLTIRQAFLQGVTLPEVNFTQANFVQSVFTEAFVGINAVALSPDGKLLVIATGEEARLWQVANGQQYVVFKGHTDLVWSVAFSPDGRTLASGSADQTVRLWDVYTGQALRTLPGHTDWVWSVAFRPDGEMLASSSEDQTVRLWNVHTGQTLLILQGHTKGVFSVAFNSDGDILASSGEDQTVRLWSAHSGQSLRTLPGHTNMVCCVAFSPDGKTLASGSYDQTIRLWDVGSGRTFHILHGHTNSVSSLAFSPDGRTLASGSYDQTIRIWDPYTGQTLRILRGHTQEIRSVAFSSDGKTLVDGSYDQTIRSWDIRTGRVVLTLRGHTQEARSVAFSPDGKTLATGGADQVVRLWDAHTGQVRHTLHGHRRWVASVAFSPDGKTLASGSYDRMVRLWDVRTGQLLRLGHRHVHWVWFVTFNPNGETLASGGAGRTVHLWDVRTGKTLHILDEHTRGIWCAAFSPDGEILASGSEDQTVRIWDVGTGQALHILQGHTSAVNCVAFSPDGEILTSGSDDQTLHLWDTRTGQALRTLEGHTNAVSDVAFSPDGRILASSSADQTVRLWDMHAGQVLRILYEHTNTVSSIAFSPDGATLASASLDGSVKLWRVGTGECLNTLRSERPYEGMNIAAVAGLTEAQKATLKALGAVEQ